MMVQAASRRHASALHGCGRISCWCRCARRPRLRPSPRAASANRRLPSCSRPAPRSGRVNRALRPAVNASRSRVSSRSFASFRVCATRACRASISPIPADGLQAHGGRRSSSHPGDCRRRERAWRRRCVSGWAIGCAPSMGRSRARSASTRRSTRTACRHGIMLMTRCAASARLLRSVRCPHAIERTPRRGDGRWASPACRPIQAPRVDLVRAACLVLARSAGFTDATASAPPLSRNAAASACSHARNAWKPAWLVERSG